jgi:hypothetical protein
MGILLRLFKIKMKFNDFLSKQQEIYQRFEDTTKVQSEGVTPHTLNGWGTYAIVFRHPEEVVGKIAEFIKKIASSVPIMGYDCESIHTTISDYDLREGFSPKREVLETLTNSVSLIAKDLVQPKIDYQGFLYNQNSIIVAGNPNESFLQTSLKIQESGKDNGIELRLPWGAHITAARFSQKKGSEKLSEFFELMKSSPEIGASNPFAIDVGYFKIQKDQVELETYTRFDLTK